MGQLNRRYFPILKTGNGFRWRLRVFSNTQLLFTCSRSASCSGVRMSPGESGPLVAAGAACGCFLMGSIISYSERKIKRKLLITVYLVHTRVYCGIPFN